MLTEGDGTTLEHEPVAIQGHPVYSRYDVGIEEDSLCLYTLYWMAGCHNCRPTRALAVFVATWLRGLAIALIVTGSLANAVNCGMLKLLLAGELVTFIAGCMES